ncbi:hypothetical protein L1987_59686 [Smallanthus sonchifolius]|uniref:Uncharacterized protein n=1 Tax=Smallanthus sonchifolius TaxID=185202 RepID=A0ACB9D611_9ASTR|nr:hypothetical protein L1987_59686 [Smallanthus sonchifolius]
MRQNARKLKPNPSNNQRPRNIRSSSIRDIIGDRRFNDQFNHVNTNGTDGAKKVKITKVSDGEVQDLLNLGRNSSSNQSETSEDPRGCCGDFAAKTSEYAFFKRIKENSCSNVHVNPNYHDNQLSNVQHSHHFTREEIPNVQKENIKYARSPLPNEKEQNETNYSFLSTPCCGSKNSAVNNVHGADGTNVHNVRPGEYNWLSPSVGSKIKTSGNKGVFSAKREKLRHLAADRSLYNTNEISSEGFDLVSALISRILPVVQDNNSHRYPNQDEVDPKYKLPPFSESESATQIKNHEAYKRKLIESQNLSYLDDGFFRPTKKPMDKNLLEWNPMGLESFSCGHSPNFSIRYNRCQTEGYKREFIKSHHISYLDDCFPKSTKKPIDMDILEWNPSGLESSIQYNHHRAAGGFRIQNFDMESISSFDEPLLMHKHDESHLYNEPKLLEQSQTLLLGWDRNSEKDESFLPSSTSPHSSPYITRHLKEKQLLTSSISPYTPKHLMAVEDCSIKFPFQDYNTWRMNESLNEKEHRRSEPFLFLIQSPASKPLSFLDTSLHSLVVDDEDEENFVYCSDWLLKGRVKEYSSSSYTESFLDKDFDHTDYPLLLHDSSRNDEC